MRLIFHERAWEDYLYWQATDPKLLARLNSLIKECCRTPFAGVGKPEPLRGPLAGWWSRRLEYPLCASWFLVPSSAFLQERVGENDEFAHDGGDGEFWRFTGIYEALVEGLEVWVEARGDEGRHIEGLA